MAAVPLAQAARQLRRSPATVRRWIADGAPCATPGTPGRGRGALVVVEDLQRWRATGGAPAVQSEAWLQRLAEGLMAFYREQGHRLIGMRDAHAAAYLHDLAAFIARRAGVELKAPELDMLRGLAEQGLQTARETRVIAPMQDHNKERGR